MAKKDVGHITELGAAIGRVAGVQARETVMAGSEQVADATPEQLAAWLKGAMGRLDATVDEATRARIMEQMGLKCAEVNKSHIEQALAKRNRFDTLEAFLAAETEAPSPGTRLVRAGNLVYQYYEPSAYNQRCFCLWDGLPENENVSPTWCQCSRVFVSEVWKAYTGRPVQVELAGSCISGARECKFIIHLDT